MKRKIYGMIIIVSIFLLILTGCGNFSGESSSSSSNPIISGLVADGYVKNARLTVYRSEDFIDSNIIGTGTTDDSGNFNITLTIGTIPSPIYIKSEGGTIIDTGMPAPTMLFVGNADDSGKYKITPLTDAVFKKVMAGESLSTAQTNVATKLGINSEKLYEDPVVDNDAGQALKKVLASGTQGSTLPEGNYYLYLLYFTQDDIDDLDIADTNALQNRMLRIPITVTSGGSFTGTISAAQNIDFDDDGNDDDLEIAGAITGESLFMNIDINENGANPKVFRFAGVLGLFGSSSGLCSLREGANEYNGAYVASFIPQNMTSSQATQMFSILADIMTGQSYFLFRTILFDYDGTDNISRNGDDERPEIGYGKITLTPDAGGAGMDYSGLTVNQVDYNTGRNDGNPANGVTAPLIYNNVAGDFDYLLYNGTDKTTLMSFVRTNAPDKSFFIIPAGSRKGIYIIVDTTDGNQIKHIGQIFINRKDSLAPMWEPSTNYRMDVSAVSPFLLGDTRTNALANAVPVTNTLITTPAADPDNMVMTSNFNNTTQEIVVLCGSIMAIERDWEANGDPGDDNDDGDFNEVPGDNGGDRGDYCMSIEMYETGAMIGVRLEGGEVNPPGLGVIKLYQHPVITAMFTRVDGSSGIPFKGKMKFLARAFQGGGIVQEVPVYTQGTINIDTSTGDGSLYISYIDGQGYEPDDGVNNYPQNIALTVERVSANSGLLHIYGKGQYQINESGTIKTRDIYWDLYWPVGAPKALYMFSVYDDPDGGNTHTETADTNSNGNYKVNEIGEAYVTW